MQPTCDSGHRTKNIQDTEYIKFNLQILVQAVECVRGVPSAAFKPTSMAANTLSEWCY
jgi:hypothetical protein